MREDLECKSFKWYLDTVYPELFIPGDAVASGEIRNLWSGHGNQMCVDSASKKNNLHKPVGLYPCHNQVCNFLNMYIVLNFLGGYPFENFNLSRLYSISFSGR